MDSAGPSSNVLLPLEPALPPVNELDVLDIARQSQLYTYLDHPKHAAILTCLDAKRLQVLSNGGGLRLFKHRLRPVVYVHIKGRVIGIEEKEKRIIWLVDDGTEVIAVHYQYKDQPTVPSPPSLPPRTPRSSVKGKEKARDVKVYKIPSQYQLPPLPALPRATRKQVLKMAKATIDVPTVFKIGDLLSIIGRIEVWKWSNERIICVDEVLASDVRVERAERHGTIRKADDPNQEPQHLLEALRLSAAEYSRCFKVPEKTLYPTPAIPRQSLRVLNDTRSERSFSSHKERKLRVLDDTPLEIQPKRILRVMEDQFEDGFIDAKRRTLGVPRRIINSRNEDKKVVGKEGDRSKSQERTHKSTRDVIEHKEMIPSSQTSIISVRTTDSPRHRRQLRKYTKLSDSSMTESTFRVYVEKHIVDFCSGSTTMLDLSYLLNTPKSKKRKSPGRRRSEESFEPPAFTLKYLMRIKDLRDHAKRTVEVATRRREEKRRRKAALSGSVVPIIISNEKVDDKVKRLYECVLQAMMMDGIIVLASPSASLQSPFDGKTHTGTIYEILSSSSDTETESLAKRRHCKDLDAYQVVTPALLALPVHQITSTSVNAHLNTIQILSKLQKMDERWHYIREESVQECIPVFYQAAASI